jgi:hypothetical protein
MCSCCLQLLRWWPACLSQCIRIGWFCLVVTLVCREVSIDAMFAARSIAAFASVESVQTAPSCAKSGVWMGPFNGSGMPWEESFVVENSLLPMEVGAG